jgi:hypothetical protein
MRTRAWLWPILAAVVLVVTVTVIFHKNVDAEAADAIVQAQRDIAAVEEEGSGEIDRVALRAAEADLFAAYTAFDEKRYEAALESALKASHAAQNLRARRGSTH